MLLTVRGPGTNSRGVVVDMEGRFTTVNHRVTTFHSPPIQLGLSPGHPYLLSLQPSCIEVHNTTTQGSQGQTDVRVQCLRWPETFTVIFGCVSLIVRLVTNNSAARWRRHGMVPRGFS